MAGQTDARIAELGITLPEAAKPAGSYVPYVLSGNLLYTSGQIPFGPDGLTYIGKLGHGISVEDGQQAARLCALHILAQAKAAIGDLDRIVRVVKLVGFVNSAPDFGDQPKVINGASDVMVEILGDRGRHARSAVGVANLPFGVATEVEAIIEVE